MTQIDQEALVILNELRIKSRNPTYTSMATRSKCSKSTVFAAFHGNMIQWGSLKRIAEALGADEDTVKKLQHLWVKTRVTQAPPNSMPMWAIEMDRKITEMNNKLDAIILMLVEILSK